MIMKMRGRVDGRCCLMEGVGVSAADTFAGDASFVALLSNHTDSPCVRCIKAACYATYGMEVGTW